MDYTFQRHRVDKIPRDKIIQELEIVAKHFGFKDFKLKDFEKISAISGNTVIREFGTWEKSLAFLKKRLQEQGIELKSSNRNSRKRFTEQQLLEEMGRIWSQVGHRPSQIEWDLAKPRIGFTTYIRYFDGWKNACLKFIEHKMGGSVLFDGETNTEHALPNVDEQKSVHYEAKNSRSIALGIRLKVLDRDNFRCVLCGRSPATELGVKLHLDHKIPFSQGGASTIENLQTLCQECNLGKSDSLLRSR